MKNSEITAKIKKARKEKGLTQQDLANRLNKTAAAISEIERGNVHINAADLYDLADLLDKPIEYFYSDKYMDPQEAEFVSLYRKFPEEIREKMFRVFFSSFDVQMKTIDIVAALDDSEERKMEVVLEYYKSISEQIVHLTEFRNSAIALKEKFEKEYGLGKD